jgi:hypothetical protein
VPVIALALSAGVATGQSNFPGNLEVGGYVWAEYGDGDRYPAEQGGDRFEMSQVAVELEADYQNVDAFVRLAATNVFDESAPESDVFVSDAYITWNDFAGAGSDLLVGLQPILFGLKAASLPGDRSIQAGLEFGGSEGFAVSQQVGPALIYRYQPGDTFSINAGAFDTSSSTAQYYEDTGLGEIDGSSFSSNYFVSMRWESIDGRGFYGFVGWENRYVGDAVDDSRPIFDIGVGWGNAKVDVSIEYIDLDKAFVGTLEDETYTVAEIMLHLSRSSHFYFDYAEADSSESETQRWGFIYDLNEVLGLQFEYSDDTLGKAVVDPLTGQRVEVDSFDIRMSYTF